MSIDLLIFLALVGGKWIKDRGLHKFKEWHIFLMLCFGAYTVISGLGAL